MERRPRPAALWWLAAGLTFWSFGFTRIGVGDLWWHLAAGRLIWQRRSLPAADAWSYTAAGRPWLNHEWLSDLVFHAWTSLFSVPALVWWKWALILAAWLLLFRTLQRLSGSWLAAWLAALLAIATAAPFLDVRPHLWSLLGYSILLALFIRPAPEVGTGVRPPTPKRSPDAPWSAVDGTRDSEAPPGGPRPRPAAWWLPLLFVVWVNLHGGFFFGLMVLGLVLSADLAAEWLAGRRDGLARRAVRSAALLLACALACLVNPYGVEPFLYPLKYAFDQGSPYRELIEWLPPTVPGGIRAPLYPWAIGAAVAAAAVLAAAGAFRRERRATFPLLAAALLSALTLAMSLRSRRFITLFAISASLLVAPAISELSARLAAALRERWPGLAAPHRWALAAPLLALALAVARLAPYPLFSPPAAFSPLVAEDSFPVETAAFIVANDLSGRVFNFYNWGGYLHFRSGGRMRVYIDGRADTVYDAETYRRYIRVLHGKPDQVEIVEGSGAEYVLWPRSRTMLLGPLERSGRWRRLYADTVSVLLVRDGVPVPERLLPTPESAHRELALGAEAMRTGKLAAAERHLGRAFELAPWLEMACDNLALVQERRGKVHTARATAERCRRIFPGRDLHARLRALLEREPPRR